MPKPSLCYASYDVFLDNSDVLFFSLRINILYKKIKLSLLFPFFFILLLTLSSSLLVSCSDSGTTEYDGNYSGIYNGSQLGNWSLSIINGSVYSGWGSSALGGSFTFSSGGVSSSGGFSATTSDGTTFSGQISDSKISGSWFNGSYVGYFSGQKN